MPSIRSFLTHIGASVSLAGLLIGCCDLTSMPSTVGAQPPTAAPYPFASLNSRRPCCCFDRDCTRRNKCRIAIWIWICVKPLDVNDTNLIILMKCAMSGGDLNAPHATAGYSYWTNTTFKWPLLFSAACCLAGNVAYVAAYDTRAVSLLYAARLLTGLGVYLPPYHRLTVRLRGQQSGSYLGECRRIRYGVLLKCVDATSRTVSCPTQPMAPCCLCRLQMVMLDTVRCPGQRL